MKILLLGEFSALHKNLKEGLVALGHDVDIASSGDGWKRIDADINLGSRRNGILGKLEKLLRVLIAIPKFRNYDVVQFIAPVLFPKIFGFNKSIARYVINNNEKIFLVGAGATTELSANADFCEKSYKYPGLYEQIKKSNPEMWSQTKVGRDYNRWLFERINGYIAIMYEYAQGYRDINCKKLCPTIPIPINIDNVKYQKNLVKEKVVIFHGINREGVKGTPIIREAMERLKRNYPDEVEIIIDGKMPLEQYLKFLQRVNIVVDQVYSVSYGVNAVINMAMGKVVVGGGDTECLSEFDVESCPIVTIAPDVDNIYSNLENLLKNKQEIYSLGMESRWYSEKIHDYKSIAGKYLEVWNKY